MRCLHDSETVTFYHYIETPVCTDQHLHVNVFIMVSDSWKHNGQRTLLHAHAYSCTGCQGEVGGGVPFSTALSPAELPWKQAMAGNNRRKKSWGLLHHLL